MSAFNFCRCQIRNSILWLVVLLAQQHQAFFSLLTSAQPCTLLKVVMYDEPTAGLDPVASTVVEDLIRSLQNQRGMSKSVEGISSYIVVTHQHSTIRRAVDRLIFLHEVTLVVQRLSVIGL